MYHFVAERTPEALVLSEQVKVPGHISQYLKHFQVDAVRFLFTHFGNREFCVLNDESGLGKSLVIAVFLGAFAKNKKSLIVVQNDDELVTGWRFHFSVLTSLSVSVMDVGQDSADIRGNIIIAKWATLRTVDDLSKFNFDHIIIDNRGQILSNNFCTSMLLHHYERKVNLVLSSVDITSDVKLMFNVLRLGGRLDCRYESFKDFEAKYKLPDCKDVSSKKADLEEYFLKREMLIDYCKDFRLRRYRHQVEDQLPLVDPDRYKINLDLWRTASQLSSSSERSTENMNGTNAPSDTATEELFQQALALNKEISQANEQPAELIDISDELVVMSPLMLDSDSELDDPEDVCEVIGETEDNIEQRDKSIAKNEANIVDKVQEKALNSEQNDVYEFVDLSSECIDVYGTTGSNERHSKRQEKADVDTPKTQSLRSHEKHDKRLTRTVQSTQVHETKSTNGDNSESTEKSATVKRRQKCIDPEVVVEKRLTRSTKTECSDKVPRQSFKAKPPKARSFDTKQKSVSHKCNTGKVSNSQAVAEYKKRLRSERSKNTNESTKRNEMTRLNNAATCKRKEVPKTSTINNKPLRKQRKQDLETIVVDISRGRNTRSMQRLTRSSDKLKNKYATCNFKLDTDRKQRRVFSKPSTDENADVSKENKVIRIEKVEVSKNVRQHGEDQVSSLQTNEGAAPKLSQVCILPSPECEDIPCGQKLMPDSIVDDERRNGFLVPATQRTVRSSQFKSLLATPSCLTESDVVFMPSSGTKCQNVIVLSSSADDGSLSSNSTQSRRTRALKQKKPTPGPPALKNSRVPSFGELLAEQQQQQGQHKSPDLFSASTDLGPPCTQKVSKTSSFEGFKIFGSEVKQLQQQNAVKTTKHIAGLPRKRSCLNLLEKMFEPATQKNGLATGKSTLASTAPTTTASTSKIMTRNQTPVILTLPNDGINIKKAPKHNVNNEESNHRFIDDDVFEITNNDTFGSVMRVNSNGEVSPVQPNRSTQNAQHNKITNYLIGMTQPTSGEVEEPSHANSTPSKKIQLSGTSGARKSPKSRSTQTTKLTKWFSKNAATNEAFGPKDVTATAMQLEKKLFCRSTTSRRRRLELSFKY